MAYGINLERRKFGVYYFRQTMQLDGKQVVKRISLRTKNSKVAKFLALQLKAHIDMVDLSKLKKFEVEYDDQHRIKKVVVKDEADQLNLERFLTQSEFLRAEEHKREMERLKLLQQIEQKEAVEFSQSPRGQEMAALHQSLRQLLIQPTQAVPQGESLEKLVNSYVENLDVSIGTKYKYKNVLSRLILFANSSQVTTIHGITRKFVHSYLLYLKKTEKKSEKTIANEFSPLSTFFNHMIRIGETKEPNPFTGHALDKGETDRAPFTADELEKIFSSTEVKKNKKLFYITLLLLTTGARPNEICQLWTDDIVQDKDDKTLYTIRITKNPGRDQTLKTKQSERTIYLNQLLVDVGLIAYLKTRPLGMLFDLNRPMMKNYSTFISEDFSKILRELGIKDKMMYCFRHTALTRMKHGKVDKRVAEDMVGHEGQGSAAKFYEDRHSPKLLREETEEVLRYRDIKALDVGALLS
jgi:integrase